MVRIGQRIRELREASQLSQTEIAKLCGSNQATIAKMESGKTAPSLKILLFLADYYDVSMDYICCRTDIPQGKQYTGHPKHTVDKDEMSRFVDMCFDPKSPIHFKIKESLLEILTEEGEK